MTPVPRPGSAPSATLPKAADCTGPAGRGPTLQIH